MILSCIVRSRKNRRKRQAMIDRAIDLKKDPRSVAVELSLPGPGQALGKRQIVVGLHDGQVPNGDFRIAQGTEKQNV